MLMTLSPEVVYASLTSLKYKNKHLSKFLMAYIMDHKITWIGFLSILSISLPTCESGIRRDKYLSAAIFKKAVHSDDP